ncbi:heme biosynthesis HemY N-terminal domain-containing protein [Pseudoalteromonas sp. SWN166]|uniref:heme biosynthesis HemY N-terminal domain-containing protein n=1 Tax=Pseudoalteromonas sp. SWN166 TaxID=2792061 RepID=UPI0018CE2812|nr:heme biosynthesis HemY N-terminal domain-containing protein [Pseudoalteromonas sp. SWN166]MBH0039712.1 heme biosynthesis protein HemY [Pseudoalteromonas sp. SWN166]
MIGLIILVIALVLVIGVAPYVINEKGYVLFSFNNYTVEGTMIAFCGTVIVITAIVFITYKLIRYLLSIYHNTKHGFFARSQERKQAAIEQALWSAINDDYEHVEQALSGNSVPDKFEDIRLALLAKAALANNQADKALERLFEISPEHQLKVAKLWLASGDSSAIESQMRVSAEAKKATNLELKLYAEVLVQQQHFSALEEFLPRLLRKKALTDAQWTQLFSAYFNALDADQLSEKYKQLPKKLQAHAHTAYLMQMAQAGQLAVIEGDLIKMVKHNEQHAQLANILSKATSADAAKLQVSIQDRLKKDDSNNSLLLALACLANAQGDYDLAARIFDKALNMENKKQFSEQAVLSYKNSAQAEKALVLYQ